MTNRTKLVQSLKRLKFCDPSSLEKYAVELLENHRNFFDVFRLDLAYRVLKIEKRCRAFGEIPHQLHALMGQLFHFTAESNLKDPMEQIAHACINEEFSLNPDVFEQCDITKDEVRIAIAKTCITESTGKAVHFFRRFAIKSEASRLDIACLIIQTSQIAICAYLNKLDLHSQESCIAFAWALAKANPMITCQYIKRIGIQDENVLVEIAKHCAQANPRFTRELLRKFTIQSEMKRIEIASHLLDLDFAGSLSHLRATHYLTPEGFSWACIAAVQKDASILQQSGNAIELFPFYPMDLNDPHAPDSSAIFAKTLQTIFSENPWHLEKYAQTAPEAQAVIGALIQAHCEENNEQVKELMRRWLAGLLTLMQILPATPMQWSKGFLFPLSKLRDPVMRWELTSLLLSFERHTDLHSFWQPVAENVKWNLLAISSFYLQCMGVNENLLLHIVHYLMNLPKKKCSHLLEKTNKRLMLTVLLELGKNRLHASQIEKVIRHIFYRDNELADEQTILRNLSAVNNIMRLGKTPILTYDGDLPHLFLKAFQQTFPIEYFEGDFLDAFNRRFQADDHLTPLMKYAAGIHSLNDPKALACLTEYMKSVLDNSFIERRYSLSTNPHLTTIASNRPDLLAKWREPLKMDLAPLPEEASETPLLDPKKWLTLRLIHDNHALVDIEPFLSFLSASSSEKRAIQADLGRKASALQKQMQNTPSKEQVRYKFLSICCKLAETNPAKTVEVNKLMASLMQVIKGQEGFREFQHDLKLVLKSKGPKKIPKEGLYAEVTDEPFSLLDCGTVPGSCQRVDGPPINNRGLLGYLRDGKIKMAAIRGPNGQILARCMLKILWDGSNPVLFRERIYPDQLPKTHRKILNNLTRQMAERLGIPLVSEDPTDLPYPHALQSLGSPAPYEYSDGGLNKVTNGTYTIPSTYQL